MSVALRCVRVQNFKQFKDITFDLTKKRDYAFNIDAVTEDEKYIKTALVYGKNGAGKTNLGRALIDIIYHLTDNVKEMEPYTFYLNRDSDEDFATFTYEFDINGKVAIYSYRKKLVDLCIFEQLSIDNDLVFSYDKEQGKLETPGKDKWMFNDIGYDKFMNGTISLLKYITVSSPLEPDNDLLQLTDFVDGMLFFHRINRGNQFVGFLQSPRENMATYIIKNGLLADFQAFLQQGGVNEQVISKETDGTVSFFFRHKKADLPFMDVASSGTIALLLQFYWLHKIQNNKRKASFVFLDDFDAFFHSELSDLIYKTFKKVSDIQCVMTTNNTNLLSNKTGRPDSFFIITPDKISALSELTKREIREGNNIAKLYLANEFGIK